MPLDLATRMVRRIIATLDPRLDGTMRARHSGGEVGECEAAVGHGGTVGAKMPASRQNGRHTGIEECDCDGRVTGAAGMMRNMASELTIW
jgi:hypothetical protein